MANFIIKAMKNLFTIDIEDWFHILDIPSAPHPDLWDRLPSRIQAHFYRLLDLLDEKQVKVTCFALAWLAKRHPTLLKEAVRRGHEIASHGCWHQLVYKMESHQFLQDIREARIRLEDTCGKAVQGYRAPGFSLTEHTPFFFDCLDQAGYKFDSSIFPCARGHGGILYDKYHPHTIRTQRSRIFEFPISTTLVCGKRVCFSGGGYFRFFPYAWIAAQIRAFNRQGFPVLIYIHPRDIDENQPRLAMNWKRRFKSYYGLRWTHSKLRRVLRDFEFTSIGEFIKEESHQSFFAHEHEQPFSPYQNAI